MEPKLELSQSTTVATRPATVGIGSSYGGAVMKNTEWGPNRKVDHITSNLVPWDRLDTYK